MYKNIPLARNPAQGLMMMRSSYLSLVALALLLVGLVPYTPDALHAQEKAGKAFLTIHLPDEYEYEPTEVKVDGKVFKSKGPKREYVTGVIEPGKEKTYKIEALIQPNNYTKITRTRSVTVKAGDKIKVELLKDDPKTPDRVVIRWVPTPVDIVKKMGEMAKISDKDIVYDLGCGDGITIITAVKELKAKKGVGIDINPVRVKEAKEAAKKAGIDAKIEIRKGDLLDLKPGEISDANVVMLYLGDEMNIRIRPTLWRDLKPGTRVVSHRFTMGDWKPNESITVKGEDGDNYKLHLWIVTGKEGKK